MIFAATVPSSATPNRSTSVRAARVARRRV